MIQRRCQFFFFTELRSLHPSVELIKEENNGSESSWKVWAGPEAREAEPVTAHPQRATAPVGFGPKWGLRYFPAPTSSATCSWLMHKPPWGEFRIWPEASSRVRPLRWKEEKGRRCRSRMRGSSRRRSWCGCQQQLRGGRCSFSCASTALHDFIRWKMHSHKCSGKCEQSVHVENIN